jgi:hypothetical protein
MPDKKDFKMRDFEMILRPAGEVAATENKPTEAAPIKIFCADHKVALALLEDFIVMAGAQNDVVTGKATPEQIKKLARNTNMFFVDIGDRLMVDCGLNEADIKAITDKLTEQIYKSAKAPSKEGTKK